MTRQIRGGRRFIGGWSALALALGACTVPAVAAASPLSPPSGTTVAAVTSDGTYLWMVNAPSPVTGGTASVTRVDIATGASTTDPFNVPSGASTFSIVSSGANVIVLDHNATSTTAWEFATSTLGTPQTISSVTGSTLAVSGNDLYVATPGSNVVAVYSTLGGTFNPQAPVARITLGSFGVVSPVPVAMSIDATHLWVVTGGSSNSLYEYTPNLASPATATLPVTQVFSLFAGTSSVDPSVTPIALSSNGQDVYLVSSASGQASDLFEFSTTGQYVATLTPVGTDTLSGVATDSAHVWVSDATSNQVSLVAAPGVVTSFAASVSSPSSVNLSWVAPSATGTLVSGYVVQYSTDGSTWSTLPLLAGNATGTTITGLTSPANLFYRVGALNSLVSDVSPFTGVNFSQVSAPAAPVGVSARAGSAAVAIGWTAPSATGGLPLTGYLLQVSTDSGATWTPVGTGALSASVTSYTATGLTNGLAYEFRVAAENSLGVSPYVASAPVIPSTVPLAPQALSGTASAPGAVTLNWTPPLSSGGLSVLYYDVQYSANGGATWVHAGSPVGSATSDVVTGLTNGVGYLFRVAAASYTGEGPFLSLTSLITPVGGPGAPQSVSATMRVATSATVSWKAPLTNGGLPVTSWIVQYSTTKGSTWVNAATGLPATALSTVVSGLNASLHYLFRVAAVNYSGPGAFSGGVTPISLPSAPRDVVAISHGARTVLVTWIAPSYTGGVPLNGYVVEESSTGGKTWKVLARPNGQTLSLTVGGLSNGASYLFQVAGVDPAGQGAFGRSSSVVAITTPGAPRGISASPAGSSSALVRWTAPASTGGSVLQYYVLQESSTSGKTWVTVNGTISTMSFTYTVTGLSNGLKYLFRVAAVNAAGQGTFVTTPSLVPVGSPSAPQQIRASDVNGSLLVTWRAPSTNGGSPILHYVVQASPNRGQTWRGIATLAPSTYSLSPTRLAGGVSYLFRVAALNSIMASPFDTTTTPVVFLSAPSQPRALRVLLNRAGHVIVVWDRPFTTGGSPFRGYVVRYSRNNGFTWVPVTGYQGQRATRYSFAGLQLGHAYLFDVAGVNATGRGAFSAPLRVIPVRGQRVGYWTLPLSAFLGRGTVLKVSALQRKELVRGLGVLVHEGVRHGSLFVNDPKGVSAPLGHAIAQLRGVRVSVYLTQLARVSHLGVVTFSVNVLNDPVYVSNVRMTYIVG